MNFPKLFEPLAVHGMEMKNRIVMPAMHLNYTMDGTVTDQLAAFYEARAKGGAGLIIVGGCLVNEFSGGMSMIGLQSDEYIPGLKRLVQVCRAHDARVGAQLYNAGAYAHRVFIRKQALSSSTHVSRFTNEEAREMNKEDIARTIGDFASAAARAREAGFDMVEILTGGGYLISQFLSPLINKRTDEYGGAIENRMRFGREVVHAVRAAVGKDFCVGVRLAGNDFVPGSHTNTESRMFAQVCEEAGADMFNVTGGWHETRIPQITTDLPPAGYAYLARGIREAVSIPVAASNRINRAELAEELIHEGFADLVCIARGLIADSEFPNKAREGRSREIRPCVACNQKCFDHVFLLKPVGCLTNALAGEEALRTIGTAKSPRRVLVIGGGPAGCEAALRSAGRGHQVELWEREPVLGGQVAWWSHPTGKKDFARLFEYYDAALSRAGVRVRLGEKFTPDLLEKDAFDCVLVPAGAKPTLPRVPGIEGFQVVQAWDVLKGRATTGRNVVVVGGGAVGLETAIHLASQGTLTPEQLHFLMLHEAESPETLRELMTRGSKCVTVVEMLPDAGKDIGRSTRWTVLKKTRLYGIKILTGTRLTEVTPTTVICENAQGKVIELPADSVVSAVGAEPDKGPAEELEALMPGKVRVIGDARSVGNVAQAIEEGLAAALEI